jgi:hypothetical protein
MPTDSGVARGRLIDCRRDLAALAWRGAGWPKQGSARRTIRGKTTARAGVVLGLFKIGSFQAKLEIRTGGF